MKKTMSYCLVLMMVIIAAPMIGWTQTEESQGFTIAGEIQFPKKGDLYIFLYTEEEFEESHKDDDKNDEKEPKDLKFPGHTLHIKIGEEELNAKKVEFKIENVSAGMYCILVNQDVNGNGKLDMGMFGPKEPWGNYRHKRPRFRGPKFKEMVFEVKADMTDIMIELK